MAVDCKVPSDLFMADAEKIELVLKRAVRDALLIHKRLGNPIAIWKDGRVVLLPPEQIPVDDPKDDRGVAE